ncbi:HAD family hydrolase [Nitratireductor sp. GCM10026969]|uniref:HAD family hydrolase n=1 Tax=Nitratireductor sp. GCM10026969 TaxID=3252645 RepID=UPI00360E9D47
MILFDCDGVLVDSEILSCGTDAHLMSEAGHPITAEDLIQRFIGHPKKAIWAALAEERGKPWPEGLLERAETLLMERLRTELEPVEGVAAAVSAIPGPRAVASSSSLAKLDVALTRCGLRDVFAPHIYSAEQVARGKPAPDVFLFAASQVGADPQDCIVIEDSVAGVQAARKAGMRVVGFTGGRHSYPSHGDRLMEAGAVHVVRHMRELPDFVAFLRRNALPAA